jgi:hypothetical protein
VAAVAAAVLIAAAGLAFVGLPQRRRPQLPGGGGSYSGHARPVAAHNDYPMPRAEGSYFLPSGNELSRGSLVRAGAGGAVLELGGYCRVELAPGSTVRLCGSRGQERVFLDEGIVTCEVDPKLGEFAVETEFCTVSALGTRFVVQIRQRPDAEEPGHKEALVRVLAGATLVSSAWGQELLVAR